MSMKLCSLNSGCSVGVSPYTGPETIINLGSSSGPNILTVDTSETIYELEESRNQRRRRFMTLQS